MKIVFYEMIYLCYPTSMEIRQKNRNMFEIGFVVLFDFFSICNPRILFGQIS